MTPPDSDRSLDSYPSAPTALVAALLTCGAFGVASPTPLRAQLATAGSQIWQQGVSGVPGAADGGERFGWALATGDFDGDGYDDLAIGAPDEEVSLTFAAGLVTILDGGPSGLSATLTSFGLGGLAGQVAGSSDRFGFALASGDFDDDGYDDLAIGIPDRDIPIAAGGTADYGGAILVVYGGSDGLDTSTAVLFHQEIAGIDGVGENDDAFGSALAVGDFDDDGYDDLAVGAPGESVGATNGAGAVNVIYGSASGLTATGDQIWTQGDIGDGTDDAQDHFGQELAAGDFDGDGFDDLAIGVPGKTVLAADNAGMVYQLAGSAGGLIDGLTERISTQHEIDFGTSEATDEFGSSLAAGDLDGDGIDDLVVGAPSESLQILTTTYANVGQIHVLKGTFGTGASAATAITLTRPSFSGALVEDDYFGASVAIGDFDGGVGRDLAVGVPYADLPDASDAGEVRVGYGPGFALPASPQAFSQAGAVPGLEEADDHFGYVLAVGDFDGNGFDDLAVGLPYEDVGSLDDAGAVNVLYSSGLFKDGFENGNVVRWSSTQGYGSTGSD